MNERLRLAHERTVKLYPLYAFLSHTYFWLPIFILFFLKYLNLREVLLLEALYYACVVILEVPSGYFSDRFGRKPTLIISTIALIIAYALFFVSSSFLPFAIAQVFLAIGISFNSGTDTSLHYDSLAVLKRKKEYGNREAMVSKYTFYAGAFGALFGGLIGLIDPRYAYLLAFISSIAALLTVLSMIEPYEHKHKNYHDVGLIVQIKTVVKKIKRPQVKYVFLFYVLMTVLNHIPYEFYQPYIQELLNRTQFNAANTPFLTGLHAALTMLVASLFASRSIALRNRFGLKAIFLLATCIITLIIGTMAIFTSWFVVLLALFRSSPRGIFTAPLNAAIAPEYTKEQRATYFSIQSLVGRLCFSLTLLTFSIMSGIIPGSPMKISLALGTLIGLAGCAWLFWEYIKNDRRNC